MSMCSVGRPFRRARIGSPGQPGISPAPAIDGVPFAAKYAGGVERGHHCKHLAQPFLEFSLFSERTPLGPLFSKFFGV